MFTDTHCHVLSLEYDNFDEILKNLLQNQIKRIIINGYDLKSNKEVMELVRKYPNVYGALGIHPDSIHNNADETIKFIVENINQEKIIAVGEIGLDYYYTKEEKAGQINIFNKMLEIAEENNKPVIVHSREATNDTIDNLKKHQIKGIIHCFSGSLETANEYLKLGFKLGINGILTFKNSNLPKTLSEIELKHILLETDAPYISPEPVRKEKNEPKYLIHTANKLAEIYKLNLNALSEELELNFQDIFDI